MHSITEEPRYNEVLGITNDFLCPAIVKLIYEKEPRYREHILRVPWLFVTLRFHCQDLSFHHAKKKNKRR